VTSPPPSAILAIDPGRDKCGLALVAGSGACLRRAIVPRAELLPALRQWVAETGVALAVLGDRTGSRDALAEIRGLAVFESIELVDEHRSTEEARQLYFREQPARGLARLIPAGLRSPRVPIDDFAAWVLGRRYMAAFARRGGQEG